ncbi:MAG TPA: discoidin domain-containing protein [Caproiciproducens sp.]|nr:discoidin domain-containing protein [Caproiciproducens sp.]
MQETGETLPRKLDHNNTLNNNTFHRQKQESRTIGIQKNNHFFVIGQKPKILFTASPNGAFDAAFPPLDDTYAIELYNQNYIAESTNYYSSSPLQTNVISYGVAYPDRLPFLNDKNPSYDNRNPTAHELVDFVVNGGGLLINMGYAGYGDESKVVDNINCFLGNFGAKIIWHKVTDNLHRECYNYSAQYTFYSTTNIARNELTNHVSKFWYPGGKDCYSITAYSIEPADNNWRTDIRAEDTASPKAEDGSSPILMAHRVFGKGRIVILAMDPRFGVANGSHPAYGNYILNDDHDDKQLYKNIFDWLGAPSIAQGRIYKKAASAPEILKTASVKPPRELTDRSLQQRLNNITNAKQYKGIVGVQSNLSDGEDDVEDLCRAAKAKGYHFLVFTENYDNMTEEKYSQLVKKCSAVNQNFHGFVALPGLFLPGTKDCEEPRYYGGGKRVVFNLKRWPTAEEATSPEWYHILFNQGWPSIILTEPDLGVNNPFQLMFYTGIAIHTYDGNKLVDDASDVYRKLVSSDYRLIPTAFSRIRSVDELNHFIGAVTLVCSDDISEIKNGLQTFGSSGTSYMSAGPRIDFKYASTNTAAYAGLGEQLFTNQKYAVEISASSAVGIQEVTLYRDAKVFERFYPNSTEFQKTLFFTKDANHIYIVEVTDRDNKKAVSNSIRILNFYNCFTMCTDKQNVIHNFQADGGSDGIIQSFWLSGKDLGQLYINKNSSEIAPSGEDASWAAVSVVESMPKAWTHIGKLGGNDPGVSTVESRICRLSSDDAVVVDSTICDELFSGYTRYTTFRPKLDGDNILMVEGNFITRKAVTLGNSIDNLEMIFFRVMGNYAHSPFDSYVYSPDYCTKTKGTFNDLPLSSVSAFSPVLNCMKLKEGGYIGFWASKTGNIMLFPLGSSEYDVSFGLTTSRRVFEESGSETSRNYISYGIKDPGKLIQANTKVQYRLLFVIDNGLQTDETHAEEIRSAYRLGTVKGMDAEILNGKLIDNRYMLVIQSSDYYTIIRLNKRYIPNDILPVTVNGTEQNWDAVEYDYDAKSFRKVSGINGDLYDSVKITDRQRHLFIGNPFSSTVKDLIISISRDDDGKMELFVQNPTQWTVAAKIRSSSALDAVISLNTDDLWLPGEIKVFSVTSKSAYCFECIGPADIATGALATADSCSAGFFPSHATDGLITTSWRSGNQSETHFLQLDLGKAYKINRFVVKHAGVGMESKLLNTRDFAIQYLSEGDSPDRDRWVDAVNVSDNTDSITIHDINTISTRFVRLLVNKSNSTSKNRTAVIYGLEVYPVSLPVSPTEKPVMPQVQVVTGVKSGSISGSVTPKWTEQSRMVTNAYLLRTTDEGDENSVRLKSDTEINVPGRYELSIDVINPENRLAVCSKTTFDIK